MLVVLFMFEVYFMSRMSETALLLQVEMIWWLTNHTEWHYHIVSLPFDLQPAIRATTKKSNRQTIFDDSFLPPLFIIIVNGALPKCG